MKSHCFTVNTGWFLHKTHFEVPVQLLRSECHVGSCRFSSNLMSTRHQGACVCVDAGHMLGRSAAALTMAPIMRSPTESTGFAAKSLGGSLNRVDCCQGCVCLLNFISCLFWRSQKEKKGILFSHFQSCSYSTQRQSALGWMKCAFARFNVMPQLLRWFSWARI